MAFLISRGYRQRLSCRVVGLSRSAYNRAKAFRRTGIPRADDEEFHHPLLSFANEHRSGGLSATHDEQLNALLALRRNQYFRRDLLSLRQRLIEGELPSDIARKVSVAHEHLITAK